jgi:hypothetical protein
MEPMQMQPCKGVKLRFHEGSVSITKDGSVIYFSSESFQDKFVNDKVNKLRFGQVNLLKQVTKGKWVNCIAV